MNSFYKVNKRSAWISYSILTVLLFILLPLHTVDADKADGYYEIDFEVLNADNDSVSVANDYFDKPAVLIVEEGEQSVQIGINHSAWVVGLQAPQGDDFANVEVIAEDEDEDSRVVQFTVEDGEDFTNPVEMKMHIVVDILEEDYDHEYTARFDFDEDSLSEVDTPLVEEAKEDEEVELEIDEETESESDSTTADEDKDNEIASQGVNAGTMIVIVLLVGIAGVLLYSFVFKKKK